MARPSTVTERLWAAAREAYPALVTPRDAFAQALEDDATGDAVVGAEDEAERAAEVYLACALAEGDPAAATAFEARYVAPLGTTLAKLRLSAAELAEVKQLVRAKLMVGSRLRTYAGRGRLEGLVQVTATREALSLLRKTRREVPLVDDDLAGPVERWDHGAELLKERTREAFRTAFATAAASLEPRQRTLLRLHLVGGVGLEQLAGVYGVHRATIVRWLHAAREQVRERTMAELGAGLGVGADELESLTGFVRSRLDVSLERLLSAHDAEDDAD
jgi:RNA polymerase sigma-70 factor (ECF subfamily)